MQEIIVLVTTEDVGVMLVCVQEIGLRKNSRTRAVFDEIHLPGGKLSAGCCALKYVYSLTT